MTATPAPALSDAEQEVVAAFEASPTLPEIAEARVVEEVARAICAADGETHGVTWEKFDRFERDLYRRLAAAAVAAYRAQDGGGEEAVRRVEALISPEAQMAHVLWGDRLFSEKAIRAALAAGDPS